MLQGLKLDGELALASEGCCLAQASQQHECSAAARWLSTRGLVSDARQGDGMAHQVGLLGRLDLLLSRLTDGQVGALRRQENAGDIHGCCSRR